MLVSPAKKIISKKKSTNAVSLDFLLSMYPKGDIGILNVFETHKHLKTIEN